MKKTLMLFGFIFFGFGLFADTLNLEQVRTLALLNSRSLARSNLAVRGSLLDGRNQLYTMLPSPSVRYDASINYLDNNWGLIDNPLDTFNSGISFSLTQRIFNGGKDFILRNINAIATESARKDALAEYFNVLDSADNAYYAVLEAAATLEAEESSLQTAIFSLNMAEIRHASGMINMGDYLRALAEVEVRENFRNQARRNLSLSIERLKIITELDEIPPLQQIDLSEYEELILHLGSISDAETDVLFDRFWVVFSAANPSLARAALNNQRAERNLSLTRRDPAPVVNATIFSGSIGYSASGGFGNTSGGGISITGTIPVDFWVFANRIERSKIALDSAALDYKNTENALEIELYSVLLNTLGHAGSVLSSRRTLDYIEMHFEFIMERYRLLQSSISDMQEASTMLINSRNGHTRALYGFLQSLSRLRSLGAIESEEKLTGLLMGDL